LPARLLDIARHCLCRDPNRRWTVGDIASRLNPTAAAPQPRQRIERVHAHASPRYLIPAALVLLLIATAVVSLKFFASEPKARPEPAAETEKSTEATSSQPPQAENIPASEKGQAARNERKILDDAPPPPASVHAAAPARASATGASSQDVIHRVIPDVPQTALDTIRGTVRVAIRVNVSHSGDVSEVTFDSPGPSKYFAKLAQQAAQQWKFAPIPGTASYWILRFEFSNTGAKAFSAPAAP
jgi:TonB family protein